MAKCISVQRVKVAGNIVELKRQHTGDVAGMTEEETFHSQGIVLALTKGLTCIYFIVALCALLDVYINGMEHIHDIAEALAIPLVILAISWFEVAKRKEKINKRWVRYIEGVLMVIIILLIASSIIRIVNLFESDMYKLVAISKA